MQTKRKLLLTAILWALAIGWIAVLFFFSGQTGAQSGDLSRRLTNFVLRVFPFIRLPAGELEMVLRKLAHFGIFGVEGFLLCLAMMESFLDVGVGALLTGILCTAVAAANELHQSFFEGRSCEGRDVLIDSAGAMLGILLAALLFHILRHRPHAARD